MAKQSPWVFVTDRTDVHAERFHRLFQELSPSSERLDIVFDSAGNPLATRNGSSLSSWSDIRESLGDAGLVLSGPLDTVSRHIAQGDFRHVGISWATDLMVGAGSSHQLAGQIEDAVASMDVVVTDNYAAENALVAMGVAPERIVRVPWGPEPPEALESTTAGSGLRKRLGVPADSHIILYPRALEPLYDPLVFVEAFSGLVRDYPSVCAVVVESGSLVPSVKKAVTEAGLEDRVVWAPTLSSAEFHALITESAVVVLTPQTDGTSVTLMEAMSLGTPVVTSHTSGSGEWVMDGVTGWSFPVGSAEALRVAMSRRFGASNAEVSSITQRAKRLVDSRAGWSTSSAILSKALKAL